MNHNPHYNFPCMCGMKILVLLVIVAVAAGRKTKCLPKFCDFVCGTDGVTYNSICYLGEAKREKPYLKSLYFGHCGYPLRNVICNCDPALEDDLHCANDGRTYRNECLFQCMKNNFSYLEVVKYGKCAKPLPPPPMPLCE